jgi:hypothetical protein
MVQLDFYFFFKYTYSMRENDFLQVDENAGNLKELMAQKKSMGSGILSTKPDKF